MTTVLKRQIAGLVLGLSSLLFASGVNAALLLDTSFATNFPFGPFLPTEPVEIVITLKNASSDHAITMCEGPCLGDSFTYSLGGLASIPNGYTFYFGDDPVEAVFDDQIAGTLIPGAERDFIFGVYTPIEPVSLGFYSFLPVRLGSPCRPAS
jgi:hypothetical protein